MANDGDFARATQGCTTRAVESATLTGPIFGVSAARVPSRPAAVKRAPGNSPPPPGSAHSQPGDDAHIDGVGLGDRGQGLASKRFLALVLRQLPLPTELHTIRHGTPAALAGTLAERPSLSSFVTRAMSPGLGDAINANTLGGTSKPSVHPASPRGGSDL